MSPVQDLGPECRLGQGDLLKDTLSTCAVSSSLSISLELGWETLLRLVSPVLDLGPKCRLEHEDRSQETLFTSAVSSSL